MTAPLLQVNELRAGYDARGRSGFGRSRVEIVAGIDLTLPAGGTLCVVGESGCGKSTLARTLVGLLKPFAGSIRFGGTDLATLDRRTRRTVARDIQMVFQDPYTSLNPRMRVGEAIAEGWKVHPGVVPAAERTAETARLLDLVGLDPFLADRHLHELSGGQCQRVAIARALALRPQLIVCDEAVSALDVSVRAQVLNLLADLQREIGVAYLFISHDLDVVRHIADEVAVMYAGTIVERGPAAQVFGDPQHPYTRALLAAAPSIHDRPGDDREAPLEGDVPSPGSPPSGCRFRTRCPYAAALCEQEVPALVERPSEAEPHPDHLTACHFVGNLDQSAAGR